MVFIGLILVIASVIVLFKMKSLTEDTARDLVQHIRRTYEWEKTSKAYSEKMWEAHVVSAACGVAFFIGVCLIMSTT